MLRLEARLQEFQAARAREKAAAAHELAREKETAGAQLAEREAEINRAKIHLAKTEERTKALMRELEYLKHQAVTFDSNHRESSSRAESLEPVAVP